MKLSVLENLYAAKPLEESLSIITGLGVHTVEIGAGGYPGKAHCNPEELLADKAKFNAFVDTFKNTMLRSALLPHTATRCIPMQKPPQRMTPTSKMPSCLPKSSASTR